MANLLSPENYVLKIIVYHFQSDEIERKEGSFNKQKNMITDYRFIPIYTKVEVMIINQLYPQI